MTIDKDLDSLDSVAGKWHLFPGYITHIRFPRFKNLEDGARIEFDYPITAVVGPNGSGKTSVLQALYGAPHGYSTGDFWFSTQVDPIEEGDGSPNRFIYGHIISGATRETRKARVRKQRDGRDDPNYWEPTKEVSGDGMAVHGPDEFAGVIGRSKDRWNPVKRDVLHLNFRSQLSAFDQFFYFGHAPSKKRLKSKKDVIVNDSRTLDRVIKSGNARQLFRGRPVATENRTLTARELENIGWILGRKYESAQWLRHRMFRCENGLSVLFKTSHARYSEAFAGSGEVAVASCVVEVMGAEKGTLVLLDEPEVSLHPGAQERLLHFLIQQAVSKKLQIVISTHSPWLVRSLPDKAIKVLDQRPDGRFAILPECDPYSAFRHLGSHDGGQIRVCAFRKLWPVFSRNSVRCR